MPNITSPFDYVDVLLWSAKATGNVTSPGHVALEIVSVPKFGRAKPLPRDYPFILVKGTPGLRYGFENRTCDYISLYPARMTSYLGQNVPEFKTYEEESRLSPPDLVIRLYTLDNIKMVSEFKNVESKKTATGGYILSIFAGMRSGHNCASLSYNLLVSGGIHNLVPTSVGPTAFFNTPEFVKEMVIEAKKRELYKHRQTRSYDDIEEPILYSRRDPRRWHAVYDQGVMLSTAEQLLGRSFDPGTPDPSPKPCVVM